jgi:photosystem II stability/assembly factor-like uncharacterized protein
MMHTRSSFPILFAFVCVALMLSGGCKSSTTPTGPNGEQSFGTLSGVITDSVTQKPIAQAVVQIAGVTTQKLTDALGNYKFDSVQVGPYLVTISKTGYASHADSVVITQDVITTDSRALAPTSSGTGNIAGWTLVTSGTTQNLMGVCFAGSGIYFAVGDGGAIYRSIDDGATWSVSSAGQGGKLWDITFSNKSNGIAVGANGTVVVTTNGGISWVNRSLDNNNYRSVAMIGQTAYITGDDNDGNGVVTATTDLGTTWQHLITFSNQTYPMLGVAMASLTDICVVGWYGDIGITDYGFNNWSNVSIAATRASLFSIAMPGFKDMYVVCDSGLIFHSQDSGKVWIKQNSGVGAVLRHVAFLDAKTGIAVGDGGTVILTKDGGASWQNLSIPGNTFFGCAFEDATHAIIVGSGGVIYKSKI